MSAEPNLTKHDYELLSAYLDGELTDAERSTLEARLETDNVLRQELEALRQTVGLIQQLPTLKAPRDFVLDARMVGEVKRSPVSPRVVPSQPSRRPIYLRPSIWSAAAALMLVVLGGVVIMMLSGPQIGSVSENIVSSLDNSAGAPVASVPTMVAATPMPPLPATGMRDTADADAISRTDSAIPTIPTTLEEDTGTASTGIVAQDDAASRVFVTSEAEESRFAMVTTVAPSMQDLEQPAESAPGQLIAPSVNEPQLTEMPLAAMMPPESPTNEGVFGGAGGAPSVTGASNAEAADTPRGEPLDGSVEKAASPEAVYAAPLADTVAPQSTWGSDMLVAPTATAIADVIGEQAQSLDEAQEVQPITPKSSAGLPRIVVIVTVGMLIALGLLVVRQG